MQKHSKRYRKAVEGHDRLKTFSVADAVTQVKAKASAKFDETVDIAVKLKKTG